MINCKEWLRYCELISQRPGEFQNTGTIQIVTDRSIVEQYQNETGKTVGVIYESKYNILVVDLVYEKKGEYFTYERILPATPGRAVVCIPKYRENYIMLKQYRHAMRDSQYAFPRGYATEGLSGADNARKEIEEELGAKVEKVEFLGNVVADSGLSGNRVDIYLCHISEYHNIHGYEGIIDTYSISWPELMQMIKNNEISDGLSLAACSYLACQDKSGNN